MTTEAQNTPKITIDGQSYEFTPGQTIMQVMEKYNISNETPRYCYHPGLSIAGTCRMCQVEVEKAPKLMTSCSTPAGDGMVVHTQSEKVQKSRAGVMESLLANHPLDCPVCDQAGECSLQDYNFAYGPNTSHMREEKRVYKNKTTYKLSDELTLNMNRCIHCERCVRFTEDVTKTNELIMVGRGWKKQIITAGAHGLTNDYQGCIAEICPVGAFTFNDFRFKKRVWFLKKKETICDGCSRGCNITAHVEKNKVYRYKARFNQDVNTHWMCDEGRKSFHTYETRVENVLKQENGEFSIQTWRNALEFAITKFAGAASVNVVIGTDASTEEAKLLMDEFSQISKGQISFFYANEVNAIKTSQDDKDIDSLLKRQDKTANTKGLESLGLKPFENQTADILFHARFGRSAVLASEAKFKIAFGVFSQNELKNYDLYLPGPTTLEKEGSFTNCQNITQTFKAAIKAPEQIATLTEVIAAIKELQSATTQRDIHV